jgi:hypothetical protein
MILNRKKIGLGVFIVIVIILVILLWEELTQVKQYELGEVKVEGISGYSVYFQQVNRPMEPRSEIYANILYKNKSLKKFAFGSLDFEKMELYHYKAKCKDSIIYILDDSLMIDYYDLKERNISYDSISSYLLKNDKEINRTK